MFLYAEQDEEGKVLYPLVLGESDGMKEKRGWGIETQRKRVEGGGEVVKVAYCAFCCATASFIF